MKNSILGLLLTLITSSLFAQRIVGYIPSYRSAATMDNSIEWSHLTDAYYFGAEPTTTGDVTVEVISRLNHVKTRATENNINVWLSIGGDAKSANFAGVAANATYRQTFANKLVSLCATHGLTGIDLDWEFPTPGTQANNFELLLQKIRQTFDANGSGYKLSVAAGGSPQHVPYITSGSYQYLDYLNVMSYDAPLSYSNHSSLQFLKDGMTAYYNNGCPYSKMLGGAAFYAKPTITAYSTILSASTNKQNTFETDGSGMLKYNGKVTLEAKMDYISSKGAAGIIVWEATHAVKGQYSLFKVLYDKIQVVVPGTPIITNVTLSPSSTVNTGDLVTINVTATDVGGSIASTEIKVDGTVITGTTWTATTPGDHAVAVKVTDNESNVSAVVTRTITVTSPSNGNDGFTLNNLDASSNCLLNSAPNNGGIMSHGTTTVDGPNYLQTAGLVLVSEATIPTNGTVTWFALPVVSGTGASATCDNLYTTAGGIDLTNHPKVTITAKSNTAGAELSFFLGGEGEWFPGTSTYNTGTGVTIDANYVFSAANTLETFTLDFSALDATTWNAWALRNKIQSYGFSSKTGSATFTITEIKIGSHAGGAVVPPTNQLPTISSITVAPLGTINAGDEVAFAVSSNDTDGSVVSTQMKMDGSVIYNPWTATEGVHTLSITVTDNDGGVSNSFTKVITVAGVLSLENNTATNGFKVYPNPAHGVINFSYTANGEVSIELFNALGTSVLTTTEKSIAINGLPSGIYFATLKINGVATTVQRVQVQ